MSGQTGRRGSGIHASRVLRTIGFYLVLAAILVVLLLPYYDMLATSLRTRLDNGAFPPPLIFMPTLENFGHLLETPGILEALANSLIVGLACTALALVLGLPCAYVIGRAHVRRIGTFVLIARMIPGIALVVPWYLMFSQLGLIGSYPALILSHLTVALPLVVWLTIGFFEELPDEIFAAASVDGASQAQAVLRIALPLSLGGIVSAAVLAFVGSWNNFLYSLVLGGSRPMAPMMVYRQIQELDQDWGRLAAAAILTTWPVILLAIPFTKYLIRGLTAGAVRG
jgi:multiple sugar transport system permease protein